MVLLVAKLDIKDTIAHSTIAAEFVTACETAKFVLLYRSIMYEIGLQQDMATIIHEDNKGALLNANAQQPTKHTWHMDIKYFALQDCGSLI